MKTDKKTILNMLELAAVVTLLLTSTAYAVGLLSGQSTLPTSGVIASVALGVYKDKACTQNLTSINWGTVYPSSSVTIDAYIKNTGSTNMTLQKALSNWNPTAASSYLTVNWNYSGQVIKPAQVIHLGLTLVVSSSIKNIATFSFNLNMTSSG